MNQLLRWPGGYPKSLYVMRVNGKLTAIYAVEEDEALRIGYGVEFDGYRSIPELRLAEINSAYNAAWAGENMDGAAVIMVSVPGVGLVTLTRDKILVEAHCFDWSPVARISWKTREVTKTEYMAIRTWLTTMGRS